MILTTEDYKKSIFGSNVDLPQIANSAGRKMESLKSILTERRSQVYMQR
jgi:hypothetical protein